MVLLPSRHRTATSQPMISLSGYLTIASCTRLRCPSSIRSSESKNITHGVFASCNPRLRAAAAPAVVSFTTVMHQPALSCFRAQCSNTFDVPSVLLLSTSTTGHFNPCRSSDSNVAPTISSRLNTGMTTVSKDSITYNKNEKQLFFII